MMDTAKIQAPRVAQQDDIDKQMATDRMAIALLAKRTPGVHYYADDCLDDLPDETRKHMLYACSMMGYEILMEHSAGTTVKLSFEDIKYDEESIGDWQVEASWTGNPLIGAERPLPKDTCGGVMQFMREALAAKGASLEGWIAPLDDAGDTPKSQEDVLALRKLISLAADLTPRTVYLGDGIFDMASEDERRSVLKTGALACAALTHSCMPERVPLVLTLDVISIDHLKGGTFTIVIRRLEKEIRPRDSAGSQA